MMDYKLLWDLGNIHYKNPLFPTWRTFFLWKPFFDDYSNFSNDLIIYSRLYFKTKQKSPFILPIKAGIGSKLHNNYYMLGSKSTIY